MKMSVIIVKPSTSYGVRKPVLQTSINCHKHFWQLPKERMATAVNVYDNCQDISKKKILHYKT